MTLLIVEDNATLSASLRKGLTEDGYEVDTADTGNVALRRLDRPDVDAIVLDLGLPDIDGTELLVQLRERGINAPVLVLTARDAVSSRVAVLERGADDYLVKPFEYAELLARIRALLRRAAAPRWAPLSCNGLVLDPTELVIAIGAERVRLSPREHALLALFLRRKGELLRREDVLLQVFGYNFEPGTNLVNVHITNLRKKLRDGPVVIEAVRGVGYRLRPREPGDA
ncbi:MAG TPA: response regulator transcription factor [Kofleriaceae bacterium]|nr:response regulator transcription factor [Kofleriaceae bacterium]